MHSTIEQITISLKFSWMMHSAMEQIANENYNARPILHIPRNFEVFHDRPFWPGLGDDVTATTL